MSAKRVFCSLACNRAYHEVVVAYPGDGDETHCQNCGAPLIADDRCYAVTGTAQGGRAYCGNPAKTIDANGRPVCGVHRKGNPGIMWYGDRYRYPEGTGGRWEFSKGPRRGDS